MRTGFLLLATLIDCGSVILTAALARGRQADVAWKTGGEA
jgi:hypothetical protein